jgi:hypothetical protein
MISLALGFLIGFVAGHIFGGWAVSYTKKEVDKHVGE